MGYLWAGIPTRQAHPTPGYQGSQCARRLKWHLQAERLRRGEADPTRYTGG